MIFMFFSSISVGCLPLSTHADWSGTLHIEARLHSLVTRDRTAQAPPEISQPIPNIQNSKMLVSKKMCDFENPIFLLLESHSKYWWILMIFMLFSSISIGCLHLSTPAGCPRTLHVDARLHSLVTRNGTGIASEYPNQYQTSRFRNFGPSKKYAIFENPIFLQLEIL